VVPGIAMPTEALMAMNWGLTVLKFFPAEALGGISSFSGGFFFEGIK